MPGAFKIDTGTMTDVTFLLILLAVINYVTRVSNFVTELSKNFQLTSNISFQHNTVIDKKSL